MRIRGSTSSRSFSPPPSFTLHARFNHTRSTAFDLYLNHRSSSYTLHVSAGLGP